VVIDRGDLLAGGQLDAVPTARRHEDVQQIAAVHHHVRAAVAAPEGVADVQIGQFPPGEGVAEQQPAWQHACVDDLLQDAELAEDAGRIGRELQVGADLRQFAGPLQHPDPAALTRACQRGRQAADAAADDQDVIGIAGGCCHRWPSFAKWAVTARADRRSGSTTGPVGRSQSRDTAPLGRARRVTLPWRREGEMSASPTTQYESFCRLG